MRLRLDPFSPNGVSVDNSTITVAGGSSTTGGSSVTVTGEDYLSLAAQEITANPIDLDNLSATGTPSGSTFLRGDNTWATPAGSGDVSKVGTPVNDQIGVWTGDGTIEGDANLTFDTTTDTLATVNIAPSGTVDGRDVATDGTKLDGIETGADVTDTANVTSAGALMDSELTSIADVKALNQSVISGASPNFVTTNMTSGTNKNFVTDAQATVIGNTSGTNTGDNAANTTSNTYADGKVADAINDGTTTIAPSQNAVFDALALKQPLDSDLTTIAGLTATTDNFIQSKSSAWASRTPTQVTADLINFVGDSGAGGTKGLVPAPATGDAAASKFLKADGTWTAPTGSGDVVGPASATDNAVARFNLTTGKLIQDSAVTIADTTGNITGGTYNGNTIGSGSTSGTNTGDQTNITGNAATVTTNANLTGPITSVGNATSIASQTGTGTKFVVDTSPTLITPAVTTSAIVTNTAVTTTTTDGVAVINTTAATSGNPKWSPRLRFQGSAWDGTGGSALPTYFVQEIQTSSNAQATGSLVISSSTDNSTYTPRLSVGRTGDVTISTANAALIVPGTSSGSTSVKGSSAASGTLTLPAATDTLVGKATTDTLTNKTISTGGSNSVSSGVLTNPYKFFAYRNAAANSGTGYTKVVFDTELYDTGSNFASGTFTAPVAGFYSFEWMVGFTITAGDSASALYKNGSILLWGNEVTNGGGSGGSTVLSLAANDTIDVYGVVTSTVTLNVGATPMKTYFSGHLLSIT